MELKQIGAYKIERRIGAGGMGTVYLARHVETDRQVAVKILSATLAREPGFVERFRREIDALTRLKNPHVVELYESGHEGDLYYYAMEYVCGDTITDRLYRDKRIPWREVIDIALQVCSALKAAHDAGVIHRDLKPSNLILTSDGTVKLTDFGIAQLFAASQLTATGGIVGTPEYMSPEQAEGRRATKKSDLYSLGALMYVMLTGRPPFTGKTTLDVIQKHRFGQFDRPRQFVSEIPHWLDEVVCQLLEKDPDKRYPDAYVLARRLNEVVQKVELSQRSSSDFTQHRDDASEDGERDTGAATTVYAPEPGQAPRGPGPGTLVHRLMKAELLNQQASTFWSRLFNNVWFLLACLLLVVVGGVWWFQTPPGSTETTDSAGSTALASEVQRFLELARHSERLGDVARAERILTALCTLLADQPQHRAELEHAQKQLEALQASRATQSDDVTLLQQAVSRATTLADRGHAVEARALCESILELYGSDPAARRSVESVRRVLEQLDAEPSPPSRSTPQNAEGTDR